MRSLTRFCNIIGTLLAISGPAFSLSSISYLSSLSRQAPSGASFSPTPPISPPSPGIINNGVQINGGSESVVTFAHAPISYFAIDQLTPKGPRKNPDVGQPHDATRKLAQEGALSTGSWWCAAGGWPSPSLRTTTEIFIVLSGHGCLTDMDGTQHYFGPGDTVILPKGWSGRWDVLQDIHKVWVVHNHPNVEEMSHPIRVRVIPYSTSAPQYLAPLKARRDAVHGSAPSSAYRTFYNAGPTEVGFWTCTPGSFPVVDPRECAEVFHVLEGVFFLSNADGSARRCVAGDTVMLPKGWTGHWDVMETIKKLWVVVE
ncbi:hypothetical protein ACA910_019427 [Epithemia clementina (nom. ined.)]